jgi:hypothetical protein
MCDSDSRRPWRATLTVMSPTGPVIEPPVQELQQLGLGGREAEEGESGAQVAGAGVSRWRHPGPSAAPCALRTCSRTRRPARRRRRPARRTGSGPGRRRPARSAASRPEIEAPREGYAADRARARTGSADLSRSASNRRVPRLVLESPRWNTCSDGRRTTPRRPEQTSPTILQEEA